MDIIDLEFAGEMAWLPDEYFCLSTEYGDRSRPCYFGDPDASYELVRVFTFRTWENPGSIVRIWCGR